MRGLFCPLNRGGKGTGFVGSRKATENPVTRFPPGKVVATPPKGAGPKGPRVQRILKVLRFDSGFAAEGCGIAAFGGDEFYMPLRGGGGRLLIRIRRLL